jgi:hypothetical protein
MKTYEIKSVDELGNIEIVAKCIDSEVAEELLFKLKEGDDKHSPCVYIIDVIDGE